MLAKKKCVSKQCHDNSNASCIQFWQTINHKSALCFSFFERESFLVFFPKIDCFLFKYRSNLFFVERNLNWSWNPLRSAIELSYVIWRANTKTCFTYSRVPNNHAANLILFEKQNPTYTFFHLSTQMKKKSQLHIFSPA